MGRTGLHDATREVATLAGRARAPFLGGNRS